MGPRPCPLPVLEHLRRDQLSEAQRRLGLAISQHRESSTHWKHLEEQHQALVRQVEAELATERQVLQVHDTAANRLALVRREAECRRQLAQSAARVEDARRTMQTMQQAVEHERRLVDQADRAHGLVEERLAEQRQQHQREADDRLDDEAIEQRVGRRIGTGRCG